MNPSTIYFYRVNEPYGAFSNFSPHPIEIDGKIWPTSEHYFQAQKFAGTPFEEQLRNGGAPGEVAGRGRDRSLPLRTDWESVKDDIMYRAVKAKFTQHADLQKLLLETGDAWLVEHTKNDNYWADGGDGNGKNMLGRILMKLRDELRSEGA